GLRLRAVERVQRDHQNRHVDEGERQPGPDAKEEPDSGRDVHQSDSNAPMRRAIRRYTIMIATGTVAKAAASGRLLATPTLAYTTLPMNCVFDTSCGVM